MGAGGAQPPLVLFFKGGSMQSTNIKLGVGKRAYYSARADLARKLGDIASEHHYRELCEQLPLEDSDE